MESTGENIEPVYFDDISSLSYLLDARRQHILGIKSDGTIWGIGTNTSGQLGLGNITNKTTLTQITSNIGISTPKTISYGNNYTIVLMTNGTIWGTGLNNVYQLGLGDISNRSTLTQITSSGGRPLSISCGDSHTMVLMTNKTIWGTGLNTSGQLGLGDTSNRNTLTQITSDISGCTPLSISCGGYRTMVLMTNGTIWGTGNNGSGQLGLGVGDTNIINTLTQITSDISGCKPQYISCGSDHTMVLMTNDTIWGTGFNLYGQLGLGDTSNRNTLTQITSDISGCTPLSISCGAYHTMVLMTNNTIWGTGLNTGRELGLGDTSNRNTLTQITSNIGGRTPISISSGFSNTVVLMTDGTIWITGNFGSEIGNTNSTLTKLITNNTTFIHIAGGYDVYPYPIRFNTDINVIGKDSYQNLYDTNVQPSQMTISNKNSFNNATLSSDTLQFYNMSTSLSSSYGINGASLSEPIRYNYSALSLPISDIAVGYIQDGTGEVPLNVNATDQILKTLVLGPGIWRLSGSCGFDASVAKYHILSITTLTVVPRIEPSCQTRVHSDNDALPVLQCQRVVTNDVSKTYYLVAQSEHITDILSPTVIFQAIRIA
jgi:alpha-tubulin suppressor-like RCC1 family protein